MDVEILRECRWQSWQGGICRFGRASDVEVTFNSRRNRATPQHDNSNSTGEIVTIIFILLHLVEPP